MPRIILGTRRVQLGKKSYSWIILRNSELHNGQYDGNNHHFPARETCFSQRTGQQYVLSGNILPGKNTCRNSCALGFTNGVLCDRVFRYRSHSNWLPIRLLLLDLSIDNVMRCFIWLLNVKHL